MIILGNKKISFKLLNMINRLSKEFKLGNWTLEFWNIKGENECITDMKLIHLDNNNSDSSTIKWLLHEITHILTNDSNHNNEFKIKLNKLIKKYMDKK